jgi:putative transposase
VSESKQIKCPSQATLYRLFRDISAYKADAKRFGVDEARRRNRVAVSVMKTTRLLERVELDHMQVDLLMTDPKTGLVLGRPWLTIAIDHHSRMVLGFHLSFESPNAYAVLHALVHAVLPKQALIARYPDIKNDWPAMGLPLVIVVDNGMELHGSRIQEFCLETGATLQFCPRVTPWFKPIVERFNRSLNTGLIHELPGTTFSNAIERGKYDSEKHACIDIDRFEEMLVRWIVDEYHCRPHGTLKISPLEAWRRAEKRLEVALPASPADLQLLLGATERRRIHHYGIEFDTVHYNSAELQDLYRRLVGYPGAKNKYQMVSFRVYENIDHIDVLDPDTKEYLRVPARDMEYAQDVRRSTHHLLNKLTIEQYGKDWRPSDRHTVKSKINELAEEARRNKKANKRLAKAASDTSRRKASRLGSSSSVSIEMQTELFDVSLTNHVIDSQQFAPIPVPNFSTSIAGDRHAH